MARMWHLTAPPWPQATGTLAVAGTLIKGVIKYFTALVNLARVMSPRVLAAETHLLRCTMESLMNGV